MSSYAVEIRYPGEVLEVSPLEAGRTLDTAQELWHFVLDLLPPALYLPPPGEEPGH